MTSRYPSSRSYKSRLNYSPKRRPVPRNMAGDFNWSLPPPGFPTTAKNCETTWTLLTPYLEEMGRILATAERWNREWICYDLQILSAERENICKPFLTLFSFSILFLGTTRLANMENRLPMIEFLHEYFAFNDRFNYPHQIQLTHPSSGRRNKEVCRPFGSFPLLLEPKIALFHRFQMEQKASACVRECLLICGALINSLRSSIARRLQLAPAVPPAPHF